MSSIAALPTPQVRPALLPNRLNLRLLRNLALLLLLPAILAILLLCLLSRLLWLLPGRWLDRRFPPIPLD